MSRIRTLACVAAVGAAGMLPAAAPPSQAVVTTASTATVAASSNLHALDTSKLRYVQRCWGYTGSPNHGCDVAASVPKGWKMTKLSTYHARFDDRSRTWMLRINGGLGGKQTSSAAALSKQRSLRGIPGLRIVSRVTSTEAYKPGPNPSTTVKVTTLTYTYRSYRGTRWVATRYVELWGPNVYVEITVAGRPKDQAGLKTVLTEATRTIALAG
jgi:hypothetical protein